MPVLKVTPIDNSTPGSLKLQRRLLRLTGEMERAQQQRNIAAVSEAIEGLIELVSGYLATDDGAPVAAALDECSVDEFNEIVSGLLSGGGVPPTKSDS